MQWTRLKSFGDFEGTNDMSYYPIEIGYLEIPEIIDKYMSIICEFPGFKRYRIVVHEISRRHCSNCEPISEWVLEGSDDE